MPDPDTEPAAHAIVFSKDRAFQLQELLRSLAHWKDLRISVLFTVSKKKPPKKAPVAPPAAALGEPGAVGVHRVATQLDCRCSEESYSEVARDFPHVGFIREQVL